MPVRSRRSLLTVLVLVSIVLVTVDYRAGDGGPVAAVRRGVGSVFVPLQEGLATVVRPVGNLFSSIGDFGDLRSENAQLARELEEARLQSRVQEDLERRLEEAEGQLGLREELGKRTVGARVIAEPPSDFEWTLLVNAGADEGVTEGMAVLNADGLVGKVIEVDARTARVELATSPEAGYAVRVADTGEQGLLSGRGAQPLALEPRDPDAVFEPASEVVTQSFVGSSIPDGIPIGRVADTEGGASAGVRLRAVLPYVDFTRLVQVQIVLGEEEPEPETIPSDQAAPTPDSDDLRVAVMGAVLVTALLLTTVVAPALSIAGVRPDLVLLSVIAFGLTDGPGTGARYGFSAGLVSDLVSGSSQLIGLGAFVLLLVGYLVGQSRPYVAGSPVAGRLAVTAAATVVGVLGYGVSALLLDLSTTPVGAMARSAIGLALYHVILAPLVQRPVASLSRRFPGILAGPGLAGR